MLACDLQAEEEEAAAAAAAELAEHEEQSRLTGAADDEDEDRDGEEDDDDQEEPGGVPSDLSGIPPVAEADEEQQEADEVCYQWRFYGVARGGARPLWELCPLPLFAPPL